MFKLLDQAFWKLVGSFIFILLVSFSLLTIFGAWKETKENVAAVREAFKK